MDISQPQRDGQNREDAAQAVESKLDALIARIHSLGGGGRAAAAPTANPATGSNAHTAGNHTASGDQQMTPAGPRQPNIAADSLATQQQQLLQLPDAAGGGGGGTIPPHSGGAAAPWTGGAAARTVPRPAQSLQPIQSTRFAPGPAGFNPTPDEPWRPKEPLDLSETGITETLVEGLVLRYLLSAGEAEGRAIAGQTKLPFRIAERILTELKADHRVALKAATATNDYVYTLTESGRRLAQQTTVECTYYGACPVTVGDYIASVRQQSIEGQTPHRQALERSFSDLLIDQTLFNKLGPAISSGRGMFLFGYPGNGKTSIAERVTGAFGKYIWVPYAVAIDGAVMRVFDPMLHEVAPPELSGGLLDMSSFDKRWIRIKRPTIVVGGELTMEMLEVQRNEKTHINEAPLQLKSNCGTLVIDDFGRQKMSVDKLLNRWIIPLEKRYDFLNMPGGKKVQVPFDQLVVFSTNLEPKDLVDDAFLRRIPYKIEVQDPSEANFRKLFEIMCRVLRIEHRPEVIDYLIRTHYLPVKRPFRNCQPRDLLLQIKSYCQYNQLPVELKNQYMDFAVDNYFSVM